ncbi:hypothetical protein Fmac_006422 [Flemingia macrophylla]|uniref:Uncharacterized protein n=1 Tax=Flemingia macrophylla TaxID=520843 RepID=A0ABD1NBR8_9FABA
MIAWPMFAKQFCNEKLIVEVLKIGVGIGVEAGKELVKKEDVEKATEQVMEQRGDGEHRRNRAREIKKWVTRQLKMVDHPRQIANHLSKKFCACILDRQAYMCYSIGYPHTISTHSIDQKNASPPHQIPIHYELKTWD